MFHLTNLATTII